MTGKSNKTEKDHQRYTMRMICRGKTNFWDRELNKIILEIRPKEITILMKREQGWSRIDRVKWTIKIRSNLLLILINMFLRWLRRQLRKRMNKEGSQVRTKEKRIQSRKLKIKFKLIQRRNKNQQKSSQPLWTSQKHLNHLIWDSVKLWCKSSKKNSQV